MNTTTHRCLKIVCKSFVEAETEQFKLSFNRGYKKSKNSEPKFD